jgi:hypothetical protein
MPAIIRPAELSPADKLAAAITEEDTTTTSVSASAPANAAAPASDEKPMTPDERWRAGLKAVNMTEAEALAIIDAIITKGYYEESMTLFRGRLSVTFRSRDGASLQRIASALDQCATNDPAVHRQVAGRVMLACSLVRYGNKTLEPPTGTMNPVDREKAMQASLSFIDSLSGPVVVQLYNALARFDAKVYAALADGSLEGF